MKKRKPWRPGIVQLRARLRKIYVESMLNEGGMTMAAVARQLGVTRQAVHQYLGDHQPLQAEGQRKRSNRRDDRLLKERAKWASTLLPVVPIKLLRVTFDLPLAVSLGGSRRRQVYDYPSHERVAYLYNQGFTQKEIAEHIGWDNLGRSFTDAHRRGLLRPRRRPVWGFTGSTKMAASAAGFAEGCFQAEGGEHTEYSDGPFRHGIELAAVYLSIGGGA